MRMLRRMTAVWLTVSAVTAAASLVGPAIAPAAATVVVPIALNELATISTAITRGRIVRIDARQTSSLRVERVITFEAAEYLKGNLGAVIQFRLPGGTFGRYRTISVGAPEFKEGDEVVLFLGAREGDLPVLVGFHQGVYRVVADPATGERMVTPPLVQDIAPSASGQGATPIVRGDSSRRTLPWSQFQARVSAVVSTPPPAAAERAK